jgi:hypothetical protein
VPAVNHRSDQQPAARAADIPVQRRHPTHDQVAADDRLVEQLRAGRGTDDDDPVVRALARWRASIVRGT